MSSKEFSSLQRKNSKLQQRMWNQYTEYKEEIDALKQENIQLKKSLQLEKEKGQEIFQNFTERITKMERQLDELNYSPQQNQFYVQNSSSSKGAFSRLEQLFAQLDEEGKKIDAETQRVFELCRKPPEFYTPTSSPPPLPQQQVSQPVFKYVPITIDQYQSTPQSSSQSRQSQTPELSTNDELVFKSPEASPRDKVPPINTHSLNNNNDNYNQNNRNQYQQNNQQMQRFQSTKSVDTTGKQIANSGWDTNTMDSPFPFESPPPKQGNTQQQQQQQNTNKQKPAPLLQPEQQNTVQQDNKKQSQTSQQTKNNENPQQPQNKTSSAFSSNQIQDLNFNFDDDEEEEEEEPYNPGFTGEIHSSTFEKLGGNNNTTQTSNSSSDTKLQSQTISFGKDLTDKQSIKTVPIQTAKQDEEKASTKAISVQSQPITKNQPIKEMNQSNKPASKDDGGWGASDSDSDNLEVEIEDFDLGEPNPDNDMW